MSSNPTSVFVFDSPRTCSQLFNKLMASHPQLSNILHPLIGASMYGPENVDQHLNNNGAALAARESLARASGLMNETYAQAVDRLMGQEAALRAQGQIPWIKDHAYCATKPNIIADYVHNHRYDTPENPTVLPDSFLFGLTTIILIRHPAAILPSYYRVQAPVFQLSIEDESVQAMSSLHWSRLIFDSCHCRGQKKPIVIDAADLLSHPRALISRLCELLSLDPAGIRYDWPAVPRTQWPNDLIMQAFFQDLLQSEGVQRWQGPAASSASASASVDMDAKMKDWEADFGCEVAAKMAQLVEGEMEDYQYLWEHRLSVLQ